MTTKPPILYVAALVAVLAFAVLALDDPWLRAGLALVPAVLLAAAALRSAGGAMERAFDERRTDFAVRARIRELLDLIREFYTTCHMVAIGQLEPSKAKAKARAVEERLSVMMQEMIEQAEAAQS